MAGRHKRINDPVHGAINLTELEHAVASTRAFRRLQSVKQLGLGAMVYPGADYSRLSHSLGVCHVAGRMLDSIEAHKPQAISPRDRKLTRLAALLHDIGHYPFSHATEEVTKDLAAGSLLSGSKSPGDYFEDHEALGQYVVENDEQIGELLQGAEIDPAEVFHRIHGLDRSHLGFILSADLDCDRLDYLQRTARHAGLPYGGIDADYLISCLTLDDAGFPCLDHRAIGAADHFLVSRTYDYTQVPFHHAVVGIEEALKRVLRALSEEGRIDFRMDAIKRAVGNGNWSDFDDAHVMEKIKSFVRERSESLSPALSAAANAVLRREAPEVLYRADYFDKYDNDKMSVFTRFVENVLRAASPIAEAHGVADELIFPWRHQLHFMKQEESGQQIRVLNSFIGGAASHPISAEAGSLAAQMNGTARYQFRLYAYLPRHRRDVRGKLRQEVARVVQQHIARPQAMLRGLD